MFGCRVGDSLVRIDRDRGGSSGYVLQCMMVSSVVATVV